MPISLLHVMRILEYAAPAYSLVRVFTFIGLVLSLISFNILARLNPSEPVSEKNPSESSSTRR